MTDQILIGIFLLLMGCTFTYMYLCLLEEREKTRQARHEQYLADKDVELVRIELEHTRCRLERERWERMDEDKKRWDREMDDDDPPDTDESDDDLGMTFGGGAENN